MDVVPVSSPVDPESGPNEQRTEMSSSTEDAKSPEAFTAETDNEQLAKQVQFFLEASEDVDIDEEIIQDIFNVFQRPADVDEEDDNDAKMSTDDPTPAREDGDESDHHHDHSSDDRERSPLYEKKETVEASWSKEQVKEMMSFLKQKGSSAFIEKYVMTQGIEIPKLLHAFDIDLCPELRNLQSKTMHYFLRVAVWNKLRKRDKLPQYNTIADAVALIKKSQRILILTGAGISVSCGIPDFRSENGLYATLKNKNEYDLDDPQQMFDIHYFRENPTVFYSFASQIYPSNFVPSPCHRFIKLVEDHGKLLRNYTQNIDTLETLVGVQRVLQCHGSFATATCLDCHRKVTGTEIEADIMNQRIPLCSECNAVGAVPPSVALPVQRKKKQGKKKAQGKWDSDDEDESDVDTGPVLPKGIMKPDITFFGEKLTDLFDDSLKEDRQKVDLLLIIGTSLKVSPVADIVSHLPHSVPQILINKTPIRHINPDVVLLGNADDIVIHLCQELGWDLPPPPRPTAPSVNATSTTTATTTIVSPGVVNGNGKPSTPRPSNARKRSASEDESDAAGSSSSLATAKKAPQRVGQTHVWLFEGADGGRWLQEFKKEHKVASSPSRTSSRSRPPSARQSRQTTPFNSSQVIQNGGSLGDVQRESKKARMG